MNSDKFKIKKTIRRVIFLISLCIFLVSAYKLFWIVHDYLENKIYYNDVQKSAPKEVKEDGIKKYIFTSDQFDKLYNINNDFRGWITIPNTKVNYPIMQGVNDNFYLSAGFDKKEVNGGSIFIPNKIANPFEAQNTIIHGHHMKNGSMFGTLKKFKNEDFFNDNKIIYISLRDKCLRYEIFSVYIVPAIEEIVDTKSSPYRYIITENDEYVNYLNKLKKKSLYNRSDIGNFTKEDKIITLSTCSYEYETARMIIHAKLISDEKE